MTPRPGRPADGVIDVRAGPQMIIPSDGVRGQQTAGSGRRRGRYTGGTATNTAARRYPAGFGEEARPEAGSSYGRDRTRHLIRTGLLQGPAGRPGRRRGRSTGGTALDTATGRYSRTSTAGAWRDKLHNKTCPCKILSSTRTYT
jgi:hypothetical protein